MPGAQAGQAAVCLEHHPSRQDCRFTAKSRWANSLGTMSQMLAQCGIAECGMAELKFAAGSSVMDDRDRSTADMLLFDSSNHSVNRAQSIND